MVALCCWVLLFVPSALSFLLNSPGRTRRQAASREWRELTPAGPFGNPERRTLLKELVPGELWALDQVQGFIFVHVPVRAVVAKVSDGLVCYGGIAPTEEALELFGELETKHGAVKDIVLPSTATEHKLFAIALAKKFPNATLWAAQSQFSFPIDLPKNFLFPSNTRYFFDDDFPLEFTQLGPFYSKDSGGPSFEEIVCYHAPSRTLLACDCVLSVTDEIPEILELNDPRALEFHGRSDAQTLTDKLDGWKKIVLFALYFQSGPLQVTAEPDGTLRGALDFFRTAFPKGKSPDSKWGNFFAWSWPDSKKVDDAFATLSNNGALLVPPILALTILNRETPRVSAFVDAVCERWPAFEKVATLHFNPLTKATPQDFRTAFHAANLMIPGTTTTTRYFPPEDVAFLENFEETLVKQGAIGPRN